MSSLFVVDVEADGPCPGLYSMVSFGAVLVDSDLTTTYYGKLAPITDKWDPVALSISSTTREQHLTYDNPKSVMRWFNDWVLLKSKGSAVFVSDNPAFDWQFMNYYFHRYVGSNPFGHSARRIGDFYAGLQNDWFRASKWGHLCKRKHTHHPVDDAVGAAEGLIAMARQKNVTLPM